LTEVHGTDVGNAIWKHKKASTQTRTLKNNSKLPLMLQSTTNCAQQATAFVVVCNGGVWRCGGVWWCVVVCGGCVVV